MRLRGFHDEPAVSPAARRRLMAFQLGSGVVGVADACCRPSERQSCACWPPDVASAIIQMRGTPFAVYSMSPVTRLSAFDALGIDQTLEGGIVGPALVLARVAPASRL